LNILFILYDSFISNSAIHVHNFANALSESGHDCTVMAKSHKNSIQEFIAPHIAYTALEFADIRQKRLPFKNNQEPDIIHAWTPREAVRNIVKPLSGEYPQAKVAIHLEDNEEQILAGATRLPSAVLKFFPYFLLKKMFADQFAHPRYYKKFIADSDGFTLIMDTLQKFVPREKPSIILWPIINMDDYSVNLDIRQYRKQLGIGQNDFLVAYTGNTHQSNAEEVRSLYVSIGLANQEGLSVKLLRTGTHYCSFLQPDEAWIQDFVIELGFVSRSDLLACMTAADLLIQPGNPGPFNDYRLPSKIPEFLSMGKPVILPDSNIAHFLRDGEEAIILKHGHAEEIKNIILALNQDREQLNRLSIGGKKFAAKNFEKASIVTKLEAFYHQLLGS